MYTYVDINTLFSILRECANDVLDDIGLDKDQREDCIYQIIQTITDNLEPDDFYDYQIRVERE